MADDSTLTRSPAARASAARDNIAFADVYRPGSLATIRAMIPRESLEMIDNSAGISWLEFEHDHWLMDGMMEVFGRDEAIACWRQSIGQLVDKPLLRGFVEGALRLFGGRPGKIIKLLPKGWTLAYRDFCVPGFHATGDDSAEIHFEDIAPQAFDSEGYIHCWHAICLGVSDLEKPENGRVEFEIDRPARRAVARFTWS
jgi:hypothetical protein